MACREQFDLSTNTRAAIMVPLLCGLTIVTVGPVVPVDPVVSVVPVFPVGLIAAADPVAANGPVEPVVPVMEFGQFAAAFPRPRRQRVVTQQTGHSVTGSSRENDALASRRREPALVRSSPSG
jgi:hypothetical protein